MDFKDWKVKSADGKKAVMVHKDGHFMSVAMKSLSRMHQQQIKHLAQGGSVDLDPEKVKQFESGFSGKPAPKPPQMFDDGGMAQPDSRVFPAPQQPQLLSSDQTLNPSAGLATEQQAAQEQAEVDSAKAQAMAPIEGNMAARQQQLYNGPAKPNELQSQTAMYQELHKHADDFNKYVQENDINPQHFQESMGSGKKANMAIGLMLGGMSGGISGHGGNVAADFLNKQIDRDIAAQQQNVNNRHTVLGAYENLYGQGVVAQNLAKATMMDIYAHKVRQVAAKLGTKQAHAASLLFQAEAGFKREQSLKDASFRLGNAIVNGQPVNQPEPTEAPAPPPGASNIMSDTMGGNPATPPKAALIGGESTMLAPGAEAMMRGYQAQAEHIPGLKSALPKIQQQYDQARRAERSMQVVDDVFPKLTKERTFGEYIMGKIPHGAIAHGAEAIGLEHALKGGAGTIAKAGGAAGLAAGLGTAASGALGAIGALGPVGAGVAGLAAAATGIGAHQLGKKAAAEAGDYLDQMRQYDADKVRIAEALHTAFPNMGDHEKDKMLEKTVPKWGDSPTVLEKKASHLKSLFRSAVDTGFLEVNHLMPGRLKKK